MKETDLSFLDMEASSREGVDSPRSDNRRFWSRRRLEDWVRTIPLAAEGLPVVGEETCPPPMPSVLCQLAPACDVDQFENGRTCKIPEYKCGRVRDDGGPTTKIRKTQIRHKKKKRIKKSEITIGDLSTTYVLEKSDDTDEEYLESQRNSNDCLVEKRLTAFLRDRMLPPIRVQYGSKANSKTNDKIGRRRGNKNAGLKAARDMICAQQRGIEQDALSKRLDVEDNNPETPKFPEIKIPAVRGASVPSKRARTFIQDSQNDTNYEIHKNDKLPRLSNNERKGENYQFQKRPNALEKKEEISLPPLPLTPPVSKTEKDKHQKRLELAIAKALKKPVNTATLRWPSMKASHIIQSRTSKLPIINIGPFNYGSINENK